MIYTHAGKAHFDDFIAVALLLSKYPEQSVKRVRSMDGIAINENDFVVDTGGDYDCRQLFDHHQEKELPSSFMLVLRGIFGIGLYEKLYADSNGDTQYLFPEWIHADICDVAGPMEANKEMGVDIPFSHPAVGILTNLFSEVEELHPGDPLHRIMVRIGEICVKEFTDRWNRYKAIRDAKVVDTEKGKVLVAPDAFVDVTLASKVLGCNLIGVVCQNRDESAYSVISINNNDKFRPSLLKDVAEFVHPNGFIAVVKKDRLGIGRIISICEGE